MPSVRFEGVKLEDVTGVVSDDGLATSSELGAARNGPAFTICAISGLRIAVFVDIDPETPIIPQMVAQGCPPWLGAIVFAAVDGDLREGRAAITARIAAPSDADVATCGFAIACAAFGNGSFRHEPSSYEIGFGERVVRVRALFDVSSETWFGEAIVA